MKDLDLGGRNGQITVLIIAVLKTTGGGIKITEFAFDWICYNSGGYKAVLYKKR